MAARSKLAIRPQTSIQENLDSNQSLSDEEELEDAIFDFDCSKKLQSLYSHEKKVQSAPASQLDSLKGNGHPSTIATSKEDFRQRNPLTLHKEILPCKSEIINQLLETEHARLAHPNTRKKRLEKEKDTLPRFPFTYATTGAKRGGYNNLEKEQQEACEWSAILDEANELAGLQGKACSSFNGSVVPEEIRYHKGGRGNSRFKYSFQSLPNKEDFSRDCSLSKDETYNSGEEDIEGHAEWDYFEHETEEDTMPQPLENILEESAELVNKPVFHKQLAGAPSVSELLEDMQRTDPSLRRTLAADNIKRKERQKNSSKRTSLYLGNRVLDNKDAPEFTGDISSEDEHIDQDYQTAQIVKEQTMADLFQEAFNTSIEEIAKFSRSNKFGFHGRLQDVIQLEKDRHMKYLNELQTGRTTSNKQTVSFLSCNNSCWRAINLNATT